QSQFAGYYVALEKGFYKEVGVDVKIEHPSSSYSVVNHLISGSCQITTMNLFQAMVAIDQGLPFVHVLQTSQHNSMVIVPRYDDIETIDDLHNKKVGIWKVRFGELGLIINEERNLNIEWIPFIHNVNLFISGAIDATLATCFNEYLQILAAGFDPKHVFYLSEEGYDIPEDGLYVTSEFYRENKETVNAFVEATKRGWLWAAKNPEETLDIVMKFVQYDKIATNRIIQGKMLSEILRLQCDKQDGTPSFELHPEKVKEVNAILLKNHRIKKEVTFERLKGGETL
ncbi:MAG: ABC transporter substrate-binding protein, partial [Parabacteroides sp.]|nr:ABC transporter substrate-binding protein [Parabacteroides sp.]